MADERNSTGQSPRPSTASRLERVPAPETTPDALPLLEEAKTDADTARLRRLADRSAQPPSATSATTAARTAEREKTRSNERLSVSAQPTAQSAASTSAQSTAQAAQAAQALEPAPGRLALGIMAKLAQAEAEGMAQPRPRPASAALGLALALAAAILLPLLGGLAYLILTGISTPGIFSDVARQGLMLLADIWNALQAMAADARALVAAYPELPALAALLPLGILGVRYTVRRAAARSSSQWQKTGARLMQSPVRPARGRGG